MNEVEATKAVHELVARFPGMRFTEENSRAYEESIADLGYAETLAAIKSLADTETFFPPISKIRDTVFRARKLEHDRAVVPRLPVGDGLPSPQEWGRKVDGMLTAAERYDAMARRWYAAKGKRYPGDPGAPIIEMVKAGARGDDISDGLRRVVGDEQAVEEQEELERKYP